MEASKQPQQWQPAPRWCDLTPCHDAVRGRVGLVSYHTVTKYLLMAQLTQGIINAAIEGFESQKRRIDEQIAELRALSKGKTPAVSGAPKKKGMSAAGRKAIAEAQRKRWAAAKGQAETKSPKVAKPVKKKRVLSAAGKAAIVAALKKRWAAKKAAAKK